LQCVLVLLFLEFFGCFMGRNVQTIRCLLHMSGFSKLFKKHMKSVPIQSVIFNISTKAIMLRVELATNRTAGLNTSHSTILAILLPETA